MGNDIEELKHLQTQWDSGAAIGPRVWKAGFIDGHGPFQAPTAVYADTVEKAQADVNRYADLGYVQIKVYSSLNPEFVRRIVNTAHAHGLRVSGHVPNGMIARQFVEDGADELQHINFIFLNFLASQVKDTRTPERFTAVGTNAAKRDPQSKEVNDFIELLEKHHTTVDVTLACLYYLLVTKGQLWVDRGQRGILSSAGSNVTSPPCSAKPTAWACNRCRQRIPRATKPEASRPTRPSRNGEGEVLIKTIDPAPNHTQSLPTMPWASSKFPGEQTSGERRVSPT